MHPVNPAFVSKVIAHLSTRRKKEFFFFFNKKVKRKIEGVFGQMNRAQEIEKCQ